jgi:tol-pal system protein YbgF
MLVSQSPRSLGGSPVASIVRSRGPQWLLLAGCVAVFGCATQADVQYVREDVDQSRRQAADAKAMVESLKIDVQKLRGEIEAMKFQGDGGKLDSLTQRLDSLDARLAALEQARGTTPAPPTVGGEAAPVVAVTPAPAEGPLASISIPPSAPQEYREGIEFLRRGDNGGAIQKLREFVRKSPKSEYADDAQYWIGEAYFANRDYNRAILEFNEVLLRYPKGDKVPAALLRQALAFAELGDKVDARLVLQKLVSEHGDSPEAEKGRQKLAELSS